MPPHTCHGECWRDVPGFAGRYRVSCQGRVESLLGREPRVLRDARTGRSGHRKVILCRDGARSQVKVHRLVAAAFLGPSDAMVLHRNGDAADNRLSNLRYGDATGNAADAIRHAGGTAPNAVLDRDDVARLWAWRRQGVGQSEIARRLGTDRRIVNHIVKGRTYRHLRPAWATAEA